jgi:hydrogenase expression/formation protein HypC
MCLAVPGRIAEIRGVDELRTARVDFGGVSRDTSLLFVPEAALGDWVLVHVGFAIACIDEAVAAQALAELGRLAPPGAGDDDATS